MAGQSTSDVPALAPWVSKSQQMQCVKAASVTLQEEKKVPRILRSMRHDEDHLAGVIRHGPEAGLSAPEVSCRIFESPSQTLRNQTL